MNLQLVPEGAREIIRTIENSSHEAFLVGGCVRDLLLSVPPHDWDIATDLPAEQVISLFGEKNTIPTGLKHGTVTVVWAGEQFEITTYRDDGPFCSGGTAQYRALCDDLSRRDFTINAMAMDLQGNLIDPFHGRSHLKDRLIQCVGDPNARFQEDPLRILRGIRFASVLDFKIEPQTAHAMHTNCRLLDNVARERITVDFLKLLAGKSPGVLLKTYSPVLFQIIPELKPCDGFIQRHPWHKYDVLEHLLKTVDAVSLDGVADPKFLPLVRMAALLHDIAKPQCFTIVDGIGHFYGHAPVCVQKAADVLDQRFRFSTREKNLILHLIEQHHSRLPCSKRVARRWMARCGKTEMLLLTCLQVADIVGSGMPDEMRELQTREKQLVLNFRQLLQSMEPAEEVLSERNLVISGSDLIQLGYVPGPALGKALRTLTDLVMEEKLENSRQALLQKAAELIS